MKDAIEEYIEHFGVVDEELVAEEDAMEVAAIDDKKKDTDRRRSWSKKGKDEGKGKGKSNEKGKNKGKAFTPRVYGTEAWIKDTWPHSGAYGGPPRHAWFDGTRRWCWRKGRKHVDC